MDKIIKSQLEDCLEGFEAIYKDVENWFGALESGTAEILELFDKLIKQMRKTLEAL